MTSIIKQNDKTSTYVVQYIADTEEDVKDLPTNVYPGSTCIVASSANVYIFNNNKEWVKL
jgi:hypothetical protein